MGVDDDLASVDETEPIENLGNEYEAGSEEGDIVLKK